MCIRDRANPLEQHGSCMSYVYPAGFDIIDNAADKECKHNPIEEKISHEPALGPGSDRDNDTFSFSYDDGSSSFQDFFDED